VDPPPFELIPGTSGLTVPGFSFDEQILQLSFKDQLVQDFGGLSVDTCDVTSICDNLPLFGQNGAEKSVRSISSQSFDLGAFGGQTLSLTVLPSVSSVPVPSTLLLLAGAWFMLGRGRRDGNPSPARALH
jgi:hypothetical protein